MKIESGYEVRCSSGQADFSEFLKGRPESEMTSPFVKIFISDNCTNETLKEILGNIPPTMPIMVNFDKTLKATEYTTVLVK